jgi:hypothetical protein
LFTRFSFLARKTKASWNEPQLSIHHAIGFGENSSSSIQNVYVRSYPKGYYEGGMILNNLLVSKFSAFGVGIFYRYGTYAEPSWQNNFVVKFSLTGHID